MILLEFPPINLVLQSTFLFRNHFQKHVYTDIGGVAVFNLNL